MSLRRQAPDSSDVVSNTPIRKVLILGGGSAGWLTAGVLAAEHGDRLDISLIESPDVPTIGVGEGTWPSMRETLRKMGVVEREFIRECDVSFKQGSKFIGWRQGGTDEFYYHPFSIPQGFFEVNSVPVWQSEHADQSFASALCAQEQVSEHGLAPKQAATPDYAAVVNYAYHLDAAKFGLFLRRHCVDKLGVTHIADHVTGVTRAEDGDIASLSTREHGELPADLFVDCSGSRALLLGEELGQAYVSRRDILFNDSALAVQVPYPDDRSPIASATMATAQQAGWVWDIGLPTRRGVGYVYSSAHASDEQAEQELRAYLRGCMSEADAEKAELRQLLFEPGHRQSFWHRNCIAVGMAAGFIEPLEASALALVELSAAQLRDDMPADRATMDIAAQRFNERFLYRWDRIMDFLKLHYILSERRDTDYWLDHQREEGIPERLRELLAVWRHQAPSRRDFVQFEEIFPAASYQFVLYGMGFRTDFGAARRRSEDMVLARRQIEENALHTRRLLEGLPSNRELLSALGRG